MDTLRRYRLTSTSENLDPEVWAIQYDDTNQDVVEFLGVGTQSGVQNRQGVAFHDSHPDGIVPRHADWIVQSADTTNITIIPDAFFAANYTFAEDESPGSSR